MRKILALLLGIFIFSYANAQNNVIAPNTDYALTVNDGSLYINNSATKSYTFSNVCRLKNPTYRFLYNISWPVDIYSTQGVTLYSSFGVPVSEFSARLTHYNSPYYIVVNKKDTIAIVTQTDRIEDQIKSIQIKDFLIGEIEKIGDTILLCSPTVGIDLTQYTDVLTSGCLSPLNDSYNYQLTYYINDKIITEKYIPWIDLKDGDVIQLGINSISPKLGFVNPPCNCAESPLTFKSNKLLIRRGAVGNYSFVDKIVNICPGDSAIPFKSNPVFSRLTYKSLDDPYFITPYTIQFNPQFYKPVTITGLVYDKGRGYCWSKADTIKYIGSHDCDDGYISGSIFYDVNNNRKKDGGESSLSSKMLEIQPGNKLLYLTDGTFKGLKLPLGEKYTLSFSEDGWGTNNVQLDLTRRDTFQYHGNVNIAAVPSREQDLQIEITADRMRPGFETAYYIDIKNNSNTTLYNIYTDLYIDTTLIEINYSSPPASFIKNKIRWLIPSLPGQATLRYKVIAKVPANTDLLNKEIVSATEVIFTADKFTLNNKDTARTIVTGSFDPNDKQVFDGNGQQKKLISASSELEYMIRFQNTGTDTAFTVKVIDTLSPEHDARTLKMLSATHNYNLTIENGNILIWTFKNILLPDSTINEPKSHGFIKFSVKQKEGNPDFTAISNKAYIYFDFNEPVITNETQIIIGEEYVVTGDKKGHIKNTDLQLYPNPVSDVLNLTTKCSFEIESLSGQKMMKAENTNSVDISHLKRGIYLLKTFEGSVMKFIIE